MVSMESKSTDVESSLVKAIEFRKTQKEFIARGLAARQSSRQAGDYVGKEKSLAALDAILEKHRR